MIRDVIFFLAKTLGDLYLLAFLMRLMLQWVGADFYNPLTQTIVQITDPLVRPVRRFVPASRSVDVPTLAVLVVLEGLLTWLLLSLGRYQFVDVEPFPMLVFYRLISLTLWFYFVSILIHVLLSWVGPHGHHPVTAVLAQVNEPILRPARRLLPTFAGLDLSPLLVLIVIQAAFMLLPLPAYLG